MYEELSNSGKTHIRQAGAVRFAARPRPRVAYSTGCGAERRKQFVLENCVTDNRKLTRLSLYLNPSDTAG